MRKTVSALIAIWLILLLILFLPGCKPKENSGQTENDPDVDAADATSGSGGGEETKTGDSDPPGKIISVSAGSGHTMALDDKGRLWVWGDNFFGQVGDGNRSTYLEPVYEYHEETEYADIIDGRVRDIDNDVYTPKYIMDNVKEIFARENSSFAITKDNKLYAWGNNAYGQLGDGTKENKLKPAYIMDDVLYVDSTGFTTIILKADNSLWVAGCEIASFVYERQVYEKPVLLYKNVKKAVINGAAYNSAGILILTLDNKCIEYRPSELNSESYIFKEINIDNIIDIASASQQVYLLNTDGEVYGWGANGFDGKLGARPEEFWVYEPVFIMSGIKKIINGRMFIKNDGALLTWGTVASTEDYRGPQGELGGGVRGDLIVYGASPVSILDNIIMADGRNFHFVAVDNNGIVYTWGENFYGQLGNGTSEDKTVPAAIEFINN